MSLFFRHRRAAFLLGSTALLALSSVSAIAQSATTLSPINVEGERATETAVSPVNGYVALQTATGSKTDTPIKEIPQSISVIGRAQMADQGVQKLDEALRYTAGVFTQPYGADSDTNWAFIRGFQVTQNGIFQDGLPLFAYGFGGFFIDSHDVERIEVLRGAASVLYGGSSPGGLLNYVSKRPGGRIRSAEAGVSDTGKAWFGFDIGDKINDQFDYRVDGKIMGGRGYTDFEKGFRGTISPSLLWRPNNQTSLTLLANYTHIDEHHNGGGFLPYVGTVVDAPFGRISRKANFTEPGIDTYKREQASFGYELKHTTDTNWTFGQNFRVGYSTLHEIAPYAFGYAGFSPTPTDANNNLQRINFEHRSMVSTVLLDNNVQKTIKIGGFQHTFLFGVDYKNYQLDHMQATGDATLISANNPVYGAAQGVRTPYIDQSLNMQQVGVYLQDQIRFGDGWLVTLNGRHDDVETVGQGLPAYTRADSAWSGRAGLAYNFANGITPYASVATFFNPVIANVTTVSGVTGALPENGQQYEIGVKYVPVGMNAMFTAALFDLTKTNVITGPFFAQSQIGAVRSRGFEFEAQVNVTRDFRVLGSLTLMELKVRDDADVTLIGKTPYLLPQQQAALGFDYTFRNPALNGVTIGGGVRYIGSSWADMQNTLKVPDVTLFDAKIGYKRDNWAVNLNVANLLDKVYVAGCETALSCGYAEGRRIRLTTNVTW
jgi:iron complex outermembrane receptor protein